MRAGPFANLQIAHSSVIRLVYNDMTQVWDGCQKQAVASLAVGVSLLRWLRAGRLLVHGAAGLAYDFAS